MKNIYRQVPFVPSEQSGFEQFQYPTSHGKMTHSGSSGIYSQSGITGSMKKMNKVHLRKPQQGGKLFSQEDLLQLFSGENVMNPGSQQWGQQQKQPFWSTVIPMVGNVRPEQVKVNLNPQYRVLTIKAYPRGSRMGLTTSSNQQILHIISLPKNIQLDRVQVKLTQKGDLLVLAPYKFSQNQMGTSQYQDMENYLFQQGGSLGVNLPIKRNVGSRKSFRSQSPFRGEFTTSSSESETDTTTSTSGSETETTTTSSSSSTESEDEYQGRNLKKKLFKKRFSSGRQSQMGQTDSSNITLKVQKFIRLLQKIFFPNIVECQLKTCSTTNQPCLLLNVIPSTSQIQKNYRVHSDVQSNLLIVESHVSGSCGVRYVRRVIRLPRWLNVQQMMYQVQKQGTLQIQLPFLTNTFNPMSSLCFKPFTSSSTSSYDSKSSNIGSLFPGCGKKCQSQKYMNQCQHGGW